MDQAEVLRIVSDYVRSVSFAEPTGHDWWHVSRVLSLAEHIASAEGGADLFRVRLTALLHDVYDEKFYEGDSDAALIGLLDQLRVRDEIATDVLSGVLFDIGHLGYKGGFDRTPLSREGQMVQDADRLDAMGAIGIARAFAYGGAKGRELYNPDEGIVTVADAAEYRNGSRHTINHLYEKLLLLRDRMNTETARKIAERRHRFMEAYLAEFFAEWDCR